MGHSKGRPEREVHSDIGLPRKDRNDSNKRPNPSSTRRIGTTTTTPKSPEQWKEGNNQDQIRIKRYRD